ncbi:MAG: hypothetical protein E5V92_12640 [Mesorhizobium sp.]|nr:MAG: hypothetical protein EOS61_23340 [Mesorhizobium sp.]TIW01291.1 MAG: hypothetical protein E5V85_00190 [Mesorhizobium sp.]TJW86742.1 MAG: hypothetical protein E5V92_12640 [Mesorhizobium sp.]
MTATKGASTSLIGETFECAFGSFVPRLTVLSPTELRVRATIGTTEIDEVVHSDLTGIRPGVFIMSWTEQSGNFVVQVQDHENQVVHNYARLANGQVFCAQGAIQRVPAV